jgi:hypothetical protein
MKATPGTPTTAKLLKTGIAEEKDGRHTYQQQKSTATGEMQEGTECKQQQLCQQLPTSARTHDMT